MHLEKSPIKTASIDLVAASLVCVLPSIKNAIQMNAVSGVKFKAEMHTFRARILVGSDCWFYHDAICKHKNRKSVLHCFCFWWMVFFFFTRSLYSADEWKKKEKEEATKRFVHIVVHPLLICVIGLVENKSKNMVNANLEHRLRLWLTNTFNKIIVFDHHFLPPFRLFAPFSIPPIALRITLLFSADSIFVCVCVSVLQFAFVMENYSISFWLHFCFGPMHTQICHTLFTVSLFFFVK